MEGMNKLALPLLFLAWFAPVTLRAAEDIVIGGFEGDTYGEWKPEGEAFGTKPTDEKTAAQLGFKGFTGKGIAQSFTGRNAKLTGTLTSPEFTIDRDFINMKIGGVSISRPSASRCWWRGRKWRPSPASKATSWMR